MIILTSLKYSSNWAHMYQHLTFKKLYILPTQYIYIFRIILSTNSDYVPNQHQQVGFCTY